MNIISKLYRRFLGEDSFKDTYKDIAVLVTGSTGGQIVLFLVTPILSRIYSPQDFGHLAIYMSLMLMLGVWTTGKYELAIVIPESERKGVGLLQGTLLLNFIFSIAIVAFILLFKSDLVTYFKLDANSYWLLFIPLSIFLNAYITVFNHWNFRKRNYKANSYVLLFNAILISGLNILLGLSLIFKEGLIFSYLFSQVGVIIFYVYQLKKSNDLDQLFDLVSFSELKNILREYINFPKYQLLSELSLTASVQMIPIYFAYLFTTTVVGHLTLASRIVKAPMIIFSNSIANVFKNSAIDEFKRCGNCTQLFISLVKKLAFIVSVPFILLFFMAPFIFEIFLGSKWVLAGEFAQVLCVGLFFELLSLSFRSIFQITESQKIYMFLQKINLIIILVSIWLGYWIYNDAWHSIFFFSIANGLFHICSLIVIYRLTKSEFAASIFMAHDKVEND